MMFTVGVVVGAIACVAALTAIALFLVFHEEWDDINFDHLTEIL